MKKRDAEKIKRKRTEKENRQNKTYNATDKENR